MDSAIHIAKCYSHDVKNSLKLSVGNLELLVPTSLQVVANLALK